MAVLQAYQDDLLKDISTRAVLTGKRSLHVTTCPCHLIKVKDWAFLLELAFRNEVDAVASRFREAKGHF